jgi:phage regulator Rha-like protein
MAARRRIKQGQWPTLAGLIARIEQLPAIKAQAEPAAAADILDDVGQVPAIELASPTIVATTVQVAERLGMPHWRLLEKVRNLTGNPDGVAAANMIETTYLDGDRKRLAFDLTRHGVWLLASSTRGAAAAALRDEFAADSMSSAEQVSLASAVDRTDSFYRIGLAEGYAAGLREGRAAGYADGANDVIGEIGEHLERRVAAAPEASV